MIYKTMHAALTDGWQWTAVGTLTAALEAVAGKTVAEMREWDNGGWMYRSHGHAVLFTDGTGFALNMDDGWEGTDITGGDPASVTYYVLRAQVDAARQAEEVNRG